jgi:hypothetical protein
MDPESTTLIHNTLLDGAASTDTGDTVAKVRAAN